MSRRADGHGTCEHCHARFPYEIVHNGFNDSAFGYCDRCGTLALLSFWPSKLRSKVLRLQQGPITPEVARQLCACHCGGRFRGDAPARCPSCREPLSAELATEWIEAQAPGTKSGWRWQRNWSGMYALIIAEQIVNEPPLLDDRP